MVTKWENILCRQLRPVLWSLSVSEPKRMAFGAASYTGNGIQYNSYLMDTGDGWALLGAIPKKYLQTWIDAIQHIVGNELRWSVLFGTDDDRSAAKAVLDAYPETTILSGANGLFKLDGFLGRSEYHKIEVRNHRTLTLGGKTLSFHVIHENFDVPNIYILDQSEGILLTADAFGSVYAADGAVVSELKDSTDYLQGAANYFADIMGLRRLESLRAAVDLVKENDVRLICPSIGPIVDAEIDSLLSIFSQAEPEEKEEPTLALVYMPGNYVSEIAESIAAGINESGAVAVKHYDLSEQNREVILRELHRADAYLFGTPEINGDAAKAVWDIVTSLQKEECKNKLAAVFCSTNSIGNAAENLRIRLDQLGCNLSLKDFCIQGRPDMQSLKNAYEYGFGISCSLQKIPNPHKPVLMKCLVCGEIFDASLGECPVCGVGLEQCVPVEEDELVYRNDTENRYLILGGGIAAVSAAEAIRLRDETGTITMLSAEDYLPINRPMLTKDLETLANDPASILIHSEPWYDERKIDVHLGVSAVSMDIDAKTVTASDGLVYPYDKLIYATGAECFVPPFEGHEKSGVITIRHLWDSKELQRRMVCAEKAVVIGGGVLGLEAASELMRAGLHVTVLEATPQIVGRQIDTQSAAILKGIMEKMGVACYEGVSIAGIEGETEASGVRLTDGRVFPADFVIVSCGNRGNVGPAKAAGIIVERSIVVNQRMETSVPGVYACGDCCQFDGINFQLWQEASDQGRVAGANATGDPIEYANHLFGLNLEGFGTTLFAMGDPGKNTDVPYRTVEAIDGISGRHEKYWFFGGALQGAVTVGAPEKTAEISQAVSTHARYTELF